MLKYTGRIGCSALTDLVLKCFSDTYLSQRFGSLRYTLYWHITDNQGSFIVARVFYAHILCPRQDKICKKIYANSRYKDKSAQTVVCQISAVRSLISRRQPYCAYPILTAHTHRLVCTYVICVCHMTDSTTTRLKMAWAGINVF